MHGEDQGNQESCCGTAGWISMAMALLVAHVPAQLQHTSSIPPGLVYTASTDPSIELVQIHVDPKDNRRLTLR